MFSEAQLKCHFRCVAEGGDDCVTVHVNIIQPRIIGYSRVDSIGYRNYTLIYRLPATTSVMRLAQINSLYTQECNQPRLLGHILICKPAFTAEIQEGYISEKNVVIYGY